MKNFYPLVIVRLIIRSFQEELTDSEQQELDRWLSNESNRELYESLRHRDLQKKQGQLRQLNPDKQWKKLETSIGFRKSRLLQFTKYAAAILIPAFFISIAYTYLHQDTETPVSVSTHTSPQPGSSKAFLILGNGKTVTLSENRHFSIGTDSTITLNNEGTTLQVLSQDPRSAKDTSYQTLSIPIGGEYKLELSDGTKVWLNSDTRLHFPLVFGSDKRVVYLEGEAYFEVAHNTRQPFIVSAQGIEVEVLGTKFDVKAYPEDPVIYTTLAQGAVRTRNTRTATSLVLSPNQQCRYSKADGRMDKQNVDARTFTGWREGKFIFENETLEEIMKQLNRWYNTEVTYQTPEIKNYRFTGHVDRFEHISIILRMIEKTYNIHFDIQGNTIVVNKK